MNQIKIFTDGASLGNPGKSGWGAIISVNEDVVELGGHSDKSTNNRMEIEAVIQSLEYVKTNYKVTSSDIVVYSDSSYLINGITKWVHGWIKNGWQTKAKEAVLNKDLWQKLYDLVKGKNIKWNQLRGHADIPANEKADQIAVLFAKGEIPSLFNGKMMDYPIDLSKIEDKGEERKRDRAKAKAYSYISRVDGKIQVHKTWAECERRVKGKKNVLFKKAVSEEEEAEIKNSWKK